MRNFRTVALTLLTGITVVTWYTVFYFESRQNILVTFFDVGQGDAIFLEIPNGNQILIDGGPGDRILQKLGRIMPFWDRSIDMLVLTHPHADHLDGLLEVLKRYRVETVMESGTEHSIPEFQEWRAILREKNIKVIAARAGQKIDAGRSATIDILSPFPESALSAKDQHDAMVVSRLSHGKNSILFMGDAEKATEYLLLSEFRNSSFYYLNSDILKVGHHGSKTSTSKEFLEAVSPDVAIIQSGRKNRYGHPHGEVLERLAAIGATILRNDILGDIQFESDGETYFVNKK